MSAICCLRSVDSRYLRLGPHDHFGGAEIPLASQRHGLGEPRPAQPLAVGKVLLHGVERRRRLVIFPLQRERLPLQIRQIILRRILRRGPPRRSPLTASRSCGPASGSERRPGPSAASAGQASAPIAPHGINVASATPIARKRSRLMILSSDSFCNSFRNNLFVVAGANSSRNVRKSTANLRELLAPAVLRRYFQTINRRTEAVPCSVESRRNLPRRPSACKHHAYNSARVQAVSLTPAGQKAPGTIVGRRLQKRRKNRPNTAAKIRTKTRSNIAATRSAAASNRCQPVPQRLGIVQPQVLDVENREARRLEDVRHFAQGRQITARKNAAFDPGVNRFRPVLTDRLDQTAARGAKTTVRHASQFA